ncbi:MAG: hypothetical protein ACXWXD_07605, partial [Candidatus Deferrimicrobiaceae bacterium]
IIDAHESDDLSRSATRLRFPGDTEMAFRRYYSRNSIVIVRVALILTIVLFRLFGILSIHAAPFSKQAIWFIRFAVVIPALIDVLVFSFHPYFLRIFQPMMILVVLIVSTGILHGASGICQALRIASPGRPTCTFPSSQLDSHFL